MIIHDQLQRLILLLGRRYEHSDGIRPKDVKIDLLDPARRGRHPLAHEPCALHDPRSNWSMIAMMTTTNLCQQDGSGLNSSVAGTVSAFERRGMHTSARGATNLYLAHHREHREGASPRRAAVEVLGAESMQRTSSKMVPKWIQSSHVALGCS